MICIPLFWPALALIVIGAALGYAVIFVVALFVNMARLVMWAWGRVRGRPRSARQGTSRETIRGL